jgi:hypothetical protein
VKLSVSVTVGRRVLPLEQVTDRRIVTALEAVTQELGRKLGQVRCPTHGKPPSNVRVHFDASGSADLQYESCCEALRDVIARTLG